MLPFASLLDDARRRDLEAISLVYRQFLPGVFAYIFFRVPDRNTAEDLTSDVFVHMVERIHKVKATDEAAFAAWLFQIARTTVALTSPMLARAARMPAGGSADGGGVILRLWAPSGSPTGMWVHGSNVDKTAAYLTLREIRDTFARKGRGDHSRPRQRRVKLSSHEPEARQLGCIR